MMVSVGFFSLEVVKQLPSVTKRFFTSRAWQKLFRTEVWGFHTRLCDEAPRLRSFPGALRLFQMRQASYNPVASCGCVPYTRRRSRRAAMHAGETCSPKN